MKNADEWNARDPEDHYVYILAKVDADGFLTGPCKIGITNNPDRRLRQVRRDEGDQTVVVSFHAFWKRSHAYRVEQAFHKECGSTRVRGEWFDIAPATAVVLMDRCLREFGICVLGAISQGDAEFAFDYFSVPGEEHDFGFSFFGTLHLQ